jgi:hypothetical protein
MHIAHLSFRHFPRLLALFRPFSSYFNIASHALNKCVLRIFLSVTFLALPAFTCLALRASNKCLLPIFLSVTFLPSRLYISSLSASNKYLLFIFLSVTFLPSRPFSPNFYDTFKLAGKYLINAYCPSFFPSLSHPSRPFSALFPASFKVILACF